MMNFTTFGFEIRVYTKTVNKLAFNEIERVIKQLSTSSLFTVVDALYFHQ